MLLERAQELALDTQRAIAKHEQLDARNTELAAEVEFLRDRLDVQVGWLGLDRTQWAPMRAA